MYFLKLNSITTNRNLEQPHHHISQAWRTGAVRGNCDKAAVSYNNNKRGK